MRARRCSDVNLVSQDRLRQTASGAVFFGTVKAARNFATSLPAVAWARNPFVLAEDATISRLFLKLVRLQIRIRDCAACDLF